jgi:hypothetical protein
MANKYNTSEMTTQVKGSSSGDEDQVDVKSVAYKEMEPRWDMVADLLGGTPAMRAAATKWLPKEEDETEPKYKNRLARSFLFEAFSDTVDKLAAKPFAKPVTIKKEPVGALKDFNKDVTRCGDDINKFAQAIFADALAYGMVDILVDYPQITPTDTLADERAKGARPVFVHLQSKNILGTRTEYSEAGQQTITEIRIRECRTEPKGAFGDQEVEYVRVYRTADWELWRKDPDKKTWSMELNGAHTFGAVPVVTLTLGKTTGFRTCKLPLEALAWMNIAHWQSGSDQRNILRFARIGILFGKGFSDEQIEAGITVGPNAFVGVTSTEADLKYVGYTGTSIEAGQADLDKLEALMETLGAQPMTEKGGGQTATGKLIDDAGRVQTTIQAWIKLLENALTAAYGAACKWLGQELPAEFQIDVFSDFTLTPRASADLDWILAARAQGDLDHETVINEAKRRGVLNDDVTAESVATKLQDEGPTLGELGNEQNQGQRPPVKGQPGRSGGGQRGQGRMAG